ncbi:MAG: hypothetical protein ACI350_03440 [Prevotella sp.]
MTRRMLFAAMLAICPYMGIHAQSSAVKNVAKSVFRLTTYDKNGEIKSSSTGFYTGTGGEAVSTWKPFVGAVRATVTDASGRQAEVRSVIGANELYDVCKFRVEGKMSPVRIAVATASENEKTWMVSSGSSKSAIAPLTLQKIETFMDGYAYYVCAEEAPTDVDGSPLVNAKGEVLAMLQRSDNKLHATDVRFVNSLALDSMAIINPVLRQTSIRLDMPKDKQQALVMLMMSTERKDSLKHSQYIDDFIAQFPNEIDGYVAKAQNYMVKGLYAQADETMQQGLKQATDKADAHFEYAKIIYQKMIYSTDSVYQDWSLQKAMEEVQKACSISPQPTYRHLQAQICFSQSAFEDAYSQFMDLTRSPLRNGELFFEAAQCKTQLSAPVSEIIALLDSAVVAASQSATESPAPFVLAKGQVLDEAGEYRKALAEYNRYDTLMLGRASHAFYYTRYKCEMQVKQFQQALNDIAHAAVLNPREPTYYAELASLQLRVNMVKDAVKTADLCISFAPEYADAYIIKGIALIHDNQKEQGLEALSKAEELGDERARGLIEKYK